MVQQIIAPSVGSKASAISVGVSSDGTGLASGPEQMQSFFDGLGGVQSSLSELQAWGDSSIAGETGTSTWDQSWKDPETVNLR